MTKDIPHQALVVVADGAKAIFFRNTGRNGDISLKEERRMTSADIVHDGPSGSRPEDQSPKQTGEATFTKQLAHELHRLHTAKDYDALVLILDPQSLGQLRSALHKTVEGCVVRSLSKDLTNNSVREIEGIVAN